jgi:hypothetical protein
MGYVFGGDIRSLESSGEAICRRIQSAAIFEVAA